MPPEGDLATKLYTSDKEDNNPNNNKIIFRFKILLIDYLNELIDFSMSFPFYRRLNPLFDELFNKDTTRARAKMLRPIDKVVSLLNNSSNNRFNRR